ncbi:MAG: hypothetical protein COB02_00260 [Candidatus Cloacimonadota bacterium]|nr:MAG: hypothetical protein COB02_00260 [Candidatus Cloacimonadota bacterium]
MKLEVLMIKLILIFLLCSLGRDFGDDKFQIARLKYSGGGDWYANPTSLPNLLKGLKRSLKLNVHKDEIVVTAKNDSLWESPLLYATGHGNIDFDEIEAENLRKYLLSGGFLWVDDNYGMDKYFRINLKKLFPNEKLLALSSKHPIYNSFYKLEGLPKIHEHDKKPAQGFAIYKSGRMVLFYSYSSDIGDGLEDSLVHNDPENLRTLAKKFAINLVHYVLNESKTE